MVKGETQGGFLYLDALGGTTIVALVLLAVTTLFGSMYLQYKWARIEGAALQLAVTEMELCKYEIQSTTLGQSWHQSMDSASEYTKVVHDAGFTYTFKVEHLVTTEMVHQHVMKKLEVKVYYGKDTVISLWTYIWKGFT